MAKAAGGTEISRYRSGGGKGKTETGPGRGTAGEDIVSARHCKRSSSWVLGAILSIHTTLDDRTVRCSLRGSPLTQGPKVRTQLPPAVGQERTVRLSTACRERAPKIAGFRAAVLMVRIHLPPA